MRWLSVLLACVLGVLGAPSASGGEPQVPESLRAMLETLREARAVGGPGVVALFDADTLTKRVDAVLTEEARASLGGPSMLQKAIPRALSQPALFDPVVRQKIAAWRPSSGEEPGVVTLRVEDREGSSALERFWVVPKEDGWRIVDWEAVEVGMPLSLVVVTGLAGSFKDGDKLAGLLERQSQAMDQIDRGELEQAEAKLLVDPGFPPAPSLEAVRLALLGTVHVLMDRSEDALADTAGALRLRTDLPVAHWLRAQALAGLGRHEEAVEAVQGYVALVGDDPDALELWAALLIELERPEEAADVALRGLRENPESVDLLYMAAVGVSAARRAELIAALRAHSRWPEVAEEVAELEAAFDLPAHAFGVVAEALAGASSASPRAEIYAAVALLRSGWKPVGRDKLLALLASPDLGDYRLPVRDLLIGYIDSSTGHQGARVLERAPTADRPYLFTGLAIGRAQALDGPGLLALLVKARASRDVGPDLVYFEADLAALQGRSEEALRLLDSVKTPDPLPDDAHPLLEEVLGTWPVELRTRCLARLGRHPEALASAQRYAELFETQRMLLVVHVLSGRVEEASRAFDACVEEENEPAILLEDPDAGPLLKGPVYEALRKKHGVAN